MMKRLLFFAALIVAIGSIGGNILTAHAQTAPTTTTMSSLTPAQITALKQQLQVAQATLINLEMQNGIATPADAGTPSAIPTSIAQTGSQSATPVVAAATGLSAGSASSWVGNFGKFHNKISGIGKSGFLLFSNEVKPLRCLKCSPHSRNGVKRRLIIQAFTNRSHEEIVSNPLVFR